MTKRRGKKLSYKNKAKGEPQKQGLLVILSVSEVSTKLKRGFFATLKMTSGTAQAQAHAKQRQKAHFAIAQSTRRAAKAEQGEKPAQKCAHKSHKSEPSASTAQTPFATQIFSSQITAKRISSTKKERTRDEEITRSHHTRAF